MAISDRKFHLLAILIVAFISLSVLSNPVQQLEGHRCYWCGPLAEQIHRSQRAAKCNGDKSKVTICDEDLPYCAIVASSPPYVESRYCVKLYQDECYPLYCNSTKIWKVICPCRGELCNGLNTKRENEVFEALHKLTQTKRFKRALITNGAFIGIATRRNTVNNITFEQDVDVSTDDVKNKENDNAANSIIEISEMEVTIVSSEEPRTEVTSNENTETLTVELPPTDKLYTAKAEPDESNEKLISNENSATAAGKTTPIEKVTEEIILVDRYTAQTTDRNPTETTTQDLSPKGINQVNDIQTNNFASMGSNQNESSIKIDIPSTSIESDDLKTEIIVMSSNKPNLENDTKLSELETMVKNSPSVQTNAPKSKSTAIGVDLVTTETLPEMAVTTQIETKIEKTGSNTKGNEDLPAAEALQHNETPTTKTTEPIHTTSSAVMNIKTNLEHTTQTSMIRNNTAVRIDARILTIVLGVVLQY